MPDSKNAAKDLLSAYRQPTITPYVVECLEDFKKSVWAGMYCALLRYCVLKLKMNIQAALPYAQSSVPRFLGAFGAQGLSDKEATELAVVFQADKVEAAKCYECKAVFLRLVDDLNAEDFCLQHRHQHIPYEMPKPDQR